MFDISNNILMSPNQHTIMRSISCRGIGLHSGIVVNLNFSPAEPNTGIVFVYNRPGYQSEIIEGLYKNVVNTQLSTNLGKENKVLISTVEHLMSALHGCGIDNLIVEVDGPEIPIMDGSANAFVSLLEYAGTIEQPYKRKIIKVKKPIQVRDKNSSIRVEPCNSDDLVLNFVIDYDDTFIKKQTYSYSLKKDDFQDQICNARTYGFESDVDKLRKAGFAKGGSLENAVVVSGNKVLNKDGLRYKDEFVRHKILDLLGDLYLSGHRISANIYADKSGHALNNELLHKIFKQRDCWSFQEETSKTQDNWESAGMAALA